MIAAWITVEKKNLRPQVYVGPMYPPAAHGPVPGRARPVVKWAGGKRQIIEDLVSLVPGRFETYYEPFFGGGALLIELHNRGKLKRAVISDINSDLMDLYRIIKHRPEELIQELSGLRFSNSREDYYLARERYNSIGGSTAEKAALFIYLNRHCYNGLYRVNSRGAFNVPFGRYRSPSMPGEDEIYLLSEVLRSAEILSVDFEEALKGARNGDFVYLDPPYMPVSPSSSFTDYSSAGFSMDDQVRLCKAFRDLDRRGVLVMESNSGSELIEALYSGFEITRLRARRNINSVPYRRGPVEELVIRNYRAE